MNHEAFVIRLRDLRRQIAAARVEVLSKPSHDATGASPQAAAAQAELMRRVEGWRAALKALAAALKSKSGLIEVQSHGRLDYAQRQSLRDRAANVAMLSDEVGRLLDEIDALFDDLFREDAQMKALGDALKTILKAAKTDTGGDADRAFDHFKTIVQQQRPDQPGSAATLAAPFTSFLIAALAMWTLLRKRPDR